MMTYRPAHLLRALLLFLIVLAAPACRPAGAPTATLAPTTAPTATSIAPASTTTPAATRTPAATATDALPAVLDVQAQAGALVASERPALEELDDPAQYAMDLQLWPDQRRLAGEMTVEYTNNHDEALQELAFRLFPNLPARGAEITVGALMLDGQSVQPRYESRRTVMLVPLTPALAPEESVTLGMEFEVAIPQGPTAGYNEFAEQNGITALAGFYPLIPALRDDGWPTELPAPYGDTVFADMALFDVTLTVPRDLVVATTGFPVEQRIDESADLKTLKIVSGPAREFYIAASPAYQALAEQVGPVTIRSYFRSTDRAGGQTALRLAVESFKVFEEMFGPYPYTELDVVETATTAGGIEYPGLIVISEGFYRGSGIEGMGWVVYHEVAHQWWYSLVGNDQLREPWLDEALTNYSTWLVYERLRPAPQAQQIFESAFGRPTDLLDRNMVTKPIGLPVAEYSADEYGAVVYGKGPLFFHELRQAVGDEAFFELLREYRNRYAYKIATGRDFLALAEEISGQELEALYNEWIEGE